MNANFKIPRDSKGRVDIHLFKEAYVESHRLFSDGKRLYLRDESTRLYRILPKEGNKEILKILKKEFLMEDEQSASINDELRRVVRVRYLLTRELNLLLIRNLGIPNILMSKMALLI